MTIDIRAPRLLKPILLAMTKFSREHLNVPEDKLVDAFLLLQPTTIEPVVEPVPATPTVKIERRARVSKQAVQQTVEALPEGVHLFDAHRVHKDMSHHQVMPKDSGGAINRRLYQIQDEDGTVKLVMKGRGRTPSVWQRIASH